MRYCLHCNRKIELDEIVCEDCLLDIMLENQG